MATVVNNPNTPPAPQTVQTEGPGSGFVVGLIIVLLLVVLFFAFGLPALRGRTGTSSGTNINAPNPTVNVNPGSSGTGGTSGGSSGGSSGRGY